MLRVRGADTITAVGRDAWARMLPVAIEGFEDLQTVEPEDRAGFPWHCLLVHHRVRSICCQSRRAVYINDLRLDIPLPRNSIYFRRTIPVLNGVLRLVAALFSADLGAVATLTGVELIARRGVAPCC